MSLLQTSSRRAPAFATALAASAVLCLIALFQVGASAQTPAPQATPPPPATPRSVSVPKPVERTLTNGLRVIVIEEHDTPLVSAVTIIRNGGEVDPAELSGAADMTASLLTKGTKTRTAPEIAQAIEALGGTINSGAGWDASRASVNVMSSRFETALGILADVVRNPVFKEDEVERLRQQYLDSLSVSLRQPGTLAGYVASRVVFGNAAYGHPLSGTPESLARLKREDIVGMHSKYYRPDNAILVIGGDITADNAFKLAERLFGDWAKPSAPLPASSATKADVATIKPRVLVVDMPEAGQAAVVLARTGISRNDPEYFRGIVTNSILTGYSGRLNQEIRIKRGLSYGARSALDVRRDVGPFTASAQTKNPSGAEVASLLIGELRRLSSEAVQETEMTPRKAVLIGNFSRSLETTDGLVAQIASLALYGLSLGEINNYIGNVQAITAGDVQKFAGSRLGVQGANIIIVGNAKDFIEPLRKQFGEVEVIPLTELNLNSATLRKPGAGEMNK
ncbi:MAG TPA: pitrilysin family protein [Pyrinomonadaceae bacterium]|jgi:zinc protease|nr:pitrilysin family protein [Pyrinomonadaceae bacterium]